LETCIQVNDVKYAYPESQQALNGINFSAKKGEFIFICGANGSGKSTIGHLLNGLIPHFFGGKFEGSVKIFGVDTRNLSLAKLFPIVGMVLQNADAQLFNSSVEDELAFGLESLGLSGKQIEKRILETTRLLHITHLLKRSPDRLSGGEKRIVGIAAILCLRPSILILDEPYANLDWSGISKIRASLKKIHAAGLTVVVIEQRVDGLIKDASRCLVVEKGHIIFDGKPEDSHKILLSQKLIPQYPRRTKTNDIEAMTFWEKQKVFLSVHELFCEINGKTILKDISFNIYKGQAVALLGKNGSGKTTLIKHLNGLYRPKHGNITLNGNRFIGKNPRETAGIVGLSFQNPNDQFFKNRVVDELQIGLRLIHKNHQEWLEQICHLFQLHGLLHRSPFSLSEGEKKRVAIASVLAMKPQVLILDEPTSAQDGRSKQILATILEKLTHEEFTIIVATHDLDFARTIADRSIILDKGKIVKDIPTVPAEQAGMPIRTSLDSPYLI
jgi:energy-coupling factor transport system ATP-binding protein